MKTPDVADIIAGELQTSLAHAYELMGRAIQDRYDPIGWRWRFKEGKDRTWRYQERAFGFDPNIVEAEPLYGIFS